MPVFVTDENDRRPNAYEATLVEALEAKGIDIQASIAKWTKAANK